MRAAAEDNDMMHPMHPPATPGPAGAAAANPIPSSSPAFGTPALPFLPPNKTDTTTTNETGKTARPRSNHVLPISLPPNTLRPIAFRTFTKKHNLTLTSATLSQLATFVGKNCGQGWREEGLAEMVLEEVARSWKKLDGRVIVDAAALDGGKLLMQILKTLEGTMSGGRIVAGPRKTGLNRQTSLITLDSADTRPGLPRESSFGMSGLEVEDAGQEDEQDHSNDVRDWLRVVGAYEMPKLLYNTTRKQFEKAKVTSTLFPTPQQQTEMLKQRYYLMHQRLLRNEDFQMPTVARQSAERERQSWQVTQIANLLGRSGTSHLLLGILSISPTGTLNLNDLSGSIVVDLSRASSFNNIDMWLCAGMIVLLEGVYEEEYNPAGGSLGNTGGIGGTIGGRFVGFQVGAPRSEPRAASLGIQAQNGAELGTIGGGFGWVDFLGLGSERAVGTRMRRIEQRLLATQQQSREASSPKMVMLGEVNLDDAMVLDSLRIIFSRYNVAAEGNVDNVPVAFVLLGSFLSRAAMSSPSTHATSASTDSDTSSIAVKEHFDALATLLADFPTLLRNSTFVFVPGDNDPWPSAFTAGAATALPRQGIPEMFTSRIRRTFATANAGADINATSSKGRRKPGEAVWTSNPSRLALFGPTQEIVLFRDDISGRLRRNTLNLKAQPHRAEDVDMTDAEAPAELQHPAQQDDGLDSAQKHARRLTKTLLDQSHLSPFPLSTRPIHWSYSHALSLYPLPSALVLCDAQAEAFTVVYQGCTVLNPGKVTTPAGSGSKVRTRWIEYDTAMRRGRVMEHSP